MNIGDKFGALTVLEILGVKGGQIKVQCLCGNIKVLLRSRLLRGNDKSCGAHGAAPINIKVGDRFGALTVLELLGARNGEVKVQCICGVVKIIMRSFLLNGQNTSCGAHKSTVAKTRFTKHGAVNHIAGRRVADPEYNTWQNMRNRCLNERAEDYSYYGARGISICPEWDNYEQFLADMGKRPTPKHTIERKDNNGNYEPSNCVWETRRAQARNRAYASTKSWVLAEQLGVKMMTAHHYIWIVRSIDLGRKHPRISKELEQKVRAYLKTL